MKIKKPFVELILLLIIYSNRLYAQPNVGKPVTPNPSPEAVNLLEFIYEISGNKTMTGQHCNPLYGSIRLPSTEKVVRKYPALFGQDFGFSEPGTWDGINYRQQIVDEAIRRHNEGFVITLMWHSVRPTEEEPVEFKESIQGELSKSEWNDLITPGSSINEKWKSQVDVIAFFLKQLKYAGVPVLWRPYHEMNGHWFWWGKKEGDDGYKKLWKMLFDRLVNFHGLDNLIWVYNCNELGGDNGAYANYFPGHDFVDILATDVYSGGFAAQDYETLLELAGDKPIALGEVGAVPSIDILNIQPRWTWFMLWGEPAGAYRGGENFKTAYDSDQTITWDELPWVNIKKPKVHYPVLR